MQDAELLAGMPSDVLESGCGGEPAQPEPARLRRADRAQVRWVARSLDEAVPEDHPVRMVWAVVHRLDTSGFEEPLQARGSTPGRAATDPKILIALWLYAATEGVGCGRELDRLCEEHDAYRWILGGVSINYHTLNDFRVGHKGALDQLLITILATLMQRDLVRVRRLAHDGTRVRASAGGGSFHRRRTLERNLADAKAHVESLERQKDDAEGTARERAAREHAAKDRLTRIEEALRRLPEVEKAYQKRSPSRKAVARKNGNVPRASSTDPDARKMRMADGGWRPAYNVQVIGDTHSRAIVGVRVSNNSSDSGQAPAMITQVQRTVGGEIQDLLMDGGFSQRDTIDEMAGQGITVYAPVMEKEGVDPLTPKPGDSQAVVDWRERMATEEAKAIYKERASTIETINADLKAHRGLTQFTVRGIEKVTCVVLWSALAYNVMHFASHLLGA